MGHSPASSSPAQGGDFASLAVAMAGQPLHELCPAGPGAEAAALGFTLGLAASWAGPAGVLWAGEEGLFAEDGAPYPPGLAQFGLDPGKLVVVRAARRDDVLWAAEQGLAATGAVVICALGAGKPISLKATRRLLLFAERNRARCLILRPLAETSAAWTRWRIAPAPSRGEARELGAPAYRAELVRNRAGVSGAVYILDWNAHEHSFRERALAGGSSAAPEHGSADPRRARA